MKLNGTLEIFDWSREWQILFWKQKWAYCDQQYMKLKMSAPSTAAIVLSSGLIKEAILNINAGITLWGGVSEVVTLFDFLSKNTVNFKLNSRLVDCYQWLSCTNEIYHVGDDEALIFNVAIWHKWSYIPERNSTRDNATKIVWIKYIFFYCELVMGVGHPTEAWVHCPVSQNIPHPRCEHKGICSNLWKYSRKLCNREILSFLLSHLLITI